MRLYHCPLYYIRIRSITWFNSKQSELWDVSCLLIWSSDQGEALFVACFQQRKAGSQLIFWLGCKRFPPKPETITFFKSFIPLIKSGLKIAMDSPWLTRLKRLSIHLLRFLIHAWLYRQNNFLALVNPQAQKFGMGFIRGQFLPQGFFCGGWGGGVGWGFVEALWYFWVLIFASIRSAHSRHMEFAETTGFDMEF